MVIKGMGDSNVSVRERRAVRAILLTPDHQVLLIQMQEPQSGLALWVLPGGGIETEESVEVCLHRELYEETGLQDYELGPHVWTRENTFTWDGEIIHQQEDYYLIHTLRFQPTTKAIPDQAEIDSFCQFRWWVTPGIMQSDELFVPGKLGKHLNALIHQGIPTEPFDVGI